MANMNADAILQAIRDVVQSGTGNVRTISSGTYAGEVYATLSDDAKSTFALDKPRVEPRIVSIERHPDSPSIIATNQFYEIEVEVLLVRHANHGHALSDDTRDDLRALAARDGDVLAQALTWPGNLTQDNASNATGLVSGLLRYQGSEVGDVELTEGEPGSVETLHRFTGIVRVSA